MKNWNLKLSGKNVNIYRERQRDRERNEEHASSSRASSSESDSTLLEDAMRDLRETKSKSSSKTEVCVSFVLF